MNDIPQAASNDTRPFEILLWGATGFTGRLVAEYLLHCGPKDLRLALGGRNQAKLEALRSELAASDPRAAQLPLLLGDSGDEEGLRRLAAQARVVCTTVGPYARYGLPLVAACTAEGAHYCDITGEVPFIRRSIDAYHEQAGRDGIRVVHCCGFDSIPSDLGTLLLEDTARTRLGEPCTKVRFILQASRGSFSGGTVASMLNLMEELERDSSLGRVVSDPYALDPEDSRRGPDRREQMGVRHRKELDLWTAPFIMAGINTRVVRRSHALLGHPYGNDFSYDESMATGRGVAGSLRAALVTGGLGAFVAAMRWSPTRALLRRMVLPAPGEGPDRAARERGFFKILLAGWRDAENAGEPELRVRVSADTDPGYSATARMLGETALCLARDPLTSPGGVLTPAVAMGQVLIDRLNAAGVRFEVVEEG